MNLYEVKRLNLGDGDHFIVMNPDKTVHSSFDTRAEAEFLAAELEHLQECENPHCDMACHEA